MALPKLELKNYNSIFVDNIDYHDIELIIKENLISLCWGSENEEFYNINEVIEEFLERFKKKNTEQKYGYIGEFLYYLYILYNVDVIKPVSLFFNQEERGFKKGFDLLGYGNNELWYSEVKSGSADNKDIDDYNLERLYTAYKDIVSKLSFKNRNKNYWDTAKANICKIKFTNGYTERKEIIKILTEEKSVNKLNNIIIVSVVFSNSITPLDMSKIQDKYNKLKSNSENITIVCIRKKTIEKIIEMLLRMCSNNE